MDSIVIKVVLIFCLIGCSSQQHDGFGSGFTGDVDSFTNWLRKVIVKHLQESGLLDVVDDVTRLPETEGSTTESVPDVTTTKKSTTIKPTPSKTTTQAIPPTTQEITTHAPQHTTTTTRTTPTTTTTTTTTTTQIPPTTAQVTTTTRRPTTTTSKPKTTTAQVTTTTRRPTTTTSKPKTTTAQVTTTTRRPTTTTSKPKSKTVHEQTDVSKTDKITSDLTDAKITCTEEYRQLSGHTMCMDDDARVTKKGLTTTQELMLLRLHNEFRALSKPSATDLAKLKWDDRLAAVAQKWANQCTMGHDSERNIPDIGMTIGQNVAGGYRTWAATMQAWHDEVKIYKYGKTPDSYLGEGGLLKIGHYTQIVQNRTYLVGCGFAKCPGSFFTRYFVCDYAAGQSSVSFPYTVGPRCSSCPDSCTGGLCDCGGMVCYNGGTLNKNKCTCKCPKLYAGNMCERLNCPEKDVWVCGRDWPLNYCKAYYNVRWVCPYMCGICKHDTSTESISSTTQTEEFVSSFGCLYVGKRSEPEECQAFGDHGQDSKVCSSQGGNLGCTECKRYFNVKKDYCPVMCGLCNAPCNGRVCENGGTLDSVTCICKCKTHYSGDTCDKAVCPLADKPHCRWWPQKYCSAYFNVPVDCPYKCGICT